MKKNIKIQSGDKYGKLTILKEVDSIVDSFGQTVRIFNCLCVCGNIKNIRMNAFRTGKTKSCGCQRKGITIESNKTHGLSKSSEYRSWYAMKARCSNPNYKNYNYWGGRGIKVCDRWLNSFENFIEDMGKKPANTSLDRINNDGNYEPNNCRWATKTEQQNNRRNNKLIFISNE
jgi:hypothetical protein